MPRQHSWIKQLFRRVPRTCTRWPRLRFESLEDRTAPAAGDLDMSFGTGGVVLDSLGTSREFTRDVLVQPDGKTVVVGAVVAGEHPEMFAARYLPDGSPDPSFGTNGVVTVYLTQSDWGVAAALQGDGKILITGQSYSDFGVVRLNRDGTPDADFGTAGRVVTDLGGFNDEAIGLTLDAQGRILVTGTTISSTYARWVCGTVRYLENGQLDADFGVGGVVVTSVGTAGDSAGYSVAVQTSGRVVVGGVVYSPDVGTHMALVGYTSEGQLDPTFGDNGMVTDPAGSEIHRVRIQPDGKILAAGGVQVSRFLEDGDPDTDFATGGRFTTTVGQTPGLAVQSDGKIVVAATSASSDFATLRLTAGGELDPTYGDGGVALTDLGGYESAYGLALLPDGNLDGVEDGVVVAGESFSSPTGDQIAVASFLPDGSPDPAFGGDGAILAPHFTTIRAIPEDMALAADGSVWIASTVPNLNGGDIALSRFHPSGTRTYLVISDVGHDRSSDQARAVAVQADGKVVVAGMSSGYLFLSRYNENLVTLDPSFGNLGTTSLFTYDYDPGAFVIQPDGKFLVAAKPRSGSATRMTLLYCGSTATAPSTPPLETKVSPG